MKNSYGHIFYEREIAGQTVNLVAAGDMAFSGRIRQGKDNYEKYIESVKEYLESADVTLVNLETSVSRNSYDRLFVSDHESLRAALNAGVTHMHLANNHVYDQGPHGLGQTIQYCREVGMKIVGAGDSMNEAKSPVIVVRNGIKLCILGCGRTNKMQSTSGPNFWEYDRNELLSAVETYRFESDVIIVSIHIGLMYIDYPDPQHRELAFQLVEAGAHLILMHHAHVLQGVEVHSGSVICYNLGNFLLDWREGNVPGEVMVKEQNEGALFHFLLDRSGVARLSVVPTFMDEKCIVHLATGDKAKCIIERLVRVSAALNQGYEAEFMKQRAERNTGLTLKVIWYHVKKGNISQIWEYIRSVRLHHAAMVYRWLRLWISSN